MVFQVKITCNRCKCSFELSQKFTGGENLECPNCGQAYPNEYFRSLKEGIKLLASVPYGITLDDPKTFSVEHASGFTTVMVEGKDPFKLMQFETLP